MALGLERLTSRPVAAAAIAAATSDSTGLNWSVSGLKPGSTATLFANGSPLADTTVNGAGKASWALAGRPVGLITYDGTVTGSGGTAPAAPAGSPVNTIPPAISGTPQVGQPLVAALGAWTGAPTAYVYVFAAGATVVQSGTSSTYTPKAADAGKVITVTVFATNGVGSATATSAATAVVVAAGASVVFSRADKYYFSSTGPKRANRAGPLTADTSGAQSIYCGVYVQLANGPWAVPPGTDYLAGFGNHYGVEASLTVNEAQVPVDVTINTVAIFYTDAGGTARTVIARKTGGKVGVLSATSTDGGVIARFPIEYAIPPGAPILFGIGYAGAAGAQIPAWARPLTARGEVCRQSATDNFVALIEAKGELRSATNNNGISFGGSIPAPNWLAAMGADGRPVLMIDGDSLDYAKGTPDLVTAVGRAGGIVELAAKSLTNGGYEVTACNLSIAGTGILNTHPSAAEYTPTAQQHARALVDQLVAINGGVLPWSHYYCGHGNNGERSSLALQVEYKKARFTWLKAWHDAPIIDQTFIPKGTSTDGFRTLASQSPTGSWPDRVAYRDKLAADRLDGTVAFGIDTWTPLVAASSGADGGKFKVRPFTAKTTRAIAAQASSGFADIYLDAAPTPGMALTFLDQSNPRDPTKDVVIIVTAVVDVSANGVTEFQVSNTTGGDSAAKPAQVVGSVIAECPTTDPLPNAVGTHISHLMNLAVANYTGTDSWKGMKDALYAQSSVKWTRV